MSEAADDFAAVWKAIGEGRSLVQSEYEGTKSLEALVRPFSEAAKALESLESRLAEVETMWHAAQDEALLAQAERDAAEKAAYIEDMTWDDWTGWLDLHYPAHVFTGESDDEGPRTIALARRLAEVERERDGYRTAAQDANADAAEWEHDLAETELGLKDTLAQLTQAREALERIARVPLEEDDYVPDGTMQNIATEALATINREGEIEAAAALLFDASLGFHRLREQLTQAREALRITHGVAQSMADSDSWIAEQAGMVRGDEVGEWVVPAAVQALATINEDETPKEQLPALELETRLRGGKKVATINREGETPAQSPEGDEG